MGSKLFGLLAVVGLVLLVTTAIGIAVYQRASGDTPTRTARESAGAFAVLVPDPGETPSALEPPNLTDGELLHFGGELEFPSRLSRHSSGAISLAMGAADATSSSPAALGNRAAKAAPIVLTLPPDVEPEDVLLTAELFAAGFEIAPESQRLQSLGRQPMTWDWVLRPLGAGEQAFVVQIVATWLEDGAARTQLVWRTRDGHTIEVASDPGNPLTPEVLTITGLLGAALTLFLVPWLFTLVAFAPSSTHARGERDGSGHRDRVDEPAPRRPPPRTPRA